MGLPRALSTASFRLMRGYTGYTHIYNSFSAYALRMYMHKLSISQLILSYAYIQIKTFTTPDAPLLLPVWIVPCFHTPCDRFKHNKK